MPFVKVSQNEVLYIAFALQSAAVKFQNTDSHVNWNILIVSTENWPSKYVQVIR